MLADLLPWRRRAAEDQPINVGVLDPSGDVVVMWPGEGIPRRYPAALALAIARQVNAHPAVYGLGVKDDKTPA